MCLSSEIDVQWYLAKNCDESGRALNEKLKIEDGNANIVSVSSDTLTLRYDAGIFEFENGECYDVLNVLFETGEVWLQFGIPSELQQSDFEIKLAYIRNNPPPIPDITSKIANISNIDEFKTFVDRMLVDRQYSMGVKYTWNL
jgi:hypothetical protein